MDEAVSEPIGRDWVFSSVANMGGSLSKAIICLEYVRQQLIELGEQLNSLVYRIHDNSANLT